VLLGTDSGELNHPVVFEVLARGVDGNDGGICAAEFVAGGEVGMITGVLAADTAIRLLSFSVRTMAGRSVKHCNYIAEIL